MKLFFLLLALVAVPVLAVDRTFNVQTQTKVAPFYPQDNSTSSFWIQLPGSATYSETPALSLLQGSSYTFNLTATDLRHAFQICTYPGCGNQTLGYVTGAQGLTQLNTNFVWTPTTPGTFYYGSYNRTFMGNVITVRPNTLCNTYSDKIYSALDNVTELAFVTSLVTAIVNGTTSSSGVFATQPKFWNSSIVPIFRTTGVNWTLYGALQGHLISQLATYFGLLFGCDAPGFPSFVATSSQTLAAIHAGMNIDQADYDLFIYSAAQALRFQFAFNETDIIKSVQLLNQFRAYIDTSDNQICQGPNCLAAAVPIGTLGGLPTLQFNSVVDDRDSWKWTAVALVSLVGLLVLGGMCGYWANKGQYSALSSR